MTTIPLAWFMDPARTIHGTNFVVIVVDGIIGAGKTTYINMMKKCLGQRGWRVTIVREPVDKWVSSGILQLFYADQKRWAYHFQTKVFYDRVMENIDAFNAYKDSTDVFILERCPLTDKLFMNVLRDDGVVTDMEFNHYQEWCGMWYKLMPYAPSLFIHLNPDIDVCMSRLEERARTGEVGVTKDYQKKLMAEHSKFFGDATTNSGGATSGTGATIGSTVEIQPGHYVPSITLNTNENFRDDIPTQEKLATHFEQILTSLYNIKKVHA